MQLRLSWQQTTLFDMAPLFHDWYQPLFIPWYHTFKYDQPPIDNIQQFCSYQHAQCDVEHPTEWNSLHLFSGWDGDRGTELRMCHTDYLCYMWVGITIYYTVFLINGIYGWHTAHKVPRDDLHVRVSTKLAALSVFVSVPQGSVLVPIVFICINLYIWIKCQRYEIFGRGSGMGYCAVVAAWDIVPS